jgi:hypothetical protein
MDEGAEKHAHFALWLHGTSALETALGRRVLGRETIHEWPLSCVQRIDCAGETFIYKTQARPTVEPAFYAAASSKLLPGHRYLGKLHGCHTMAFEAIDGTRLADQPLEAPELLALGSRLQNEIDAVEGELPVYTDIRNRERWLSFVEAVLEAISGLGHDGVFEAIPDETVAGLRTWANSAGVIDLIETQSAFCHGDLNGGNIFHVGSELRLIDWQRPRFAPPSVDLAGLLLSSGQDAYAHVQREAVQILFFLTIAWSVRCQREFIPQASYERPVLAAASRLLAPPGTGS